MRVRTWYTLSMENLSIKYTVVTAPADLELLAGNSASYEDKMFDFTPEYITELQEKLEEPKAFQIIAKNDKGEFVGYIAASEIIFPDKLFIAELFVNPVFSGQGVATSLVEKSIAFAKQNELNGVMTETESDNIPAQKLYEKIGFKKIDNASWEGATYQYNF